MFVLICPECASENVSTAEQCRECGASLEKVSPAEVSNVEQSDHDAIDRLSQAENDLPGLLHALKHEDEIDVQDGDSQGDRLSGLMGSVKSSGFETPEAQETVPEWLHRIRQRASEEADSVGEITQKLSTAQESLSKDKSTSQHDNFASWIQQLREEAQDQADMKNKDDTSSSTGSDEPQEGDPDWLEKIRKVQGKPLGGKAASSPGSADHAGDSLLQWLVALEEGAEKTPQEPSVVEGETDAGEGSMQTRVSLEASGGGTTQESAITNSGSGKAVGPALSVSREEQTQADLLAATITDERAARPLLTPERKAPYWVARALVAMLFISVLIYSLFSRGNGVIPQIPLQPHCQAILSWVEKLPEDASLLIVMDVQAAFADEIMLVSRPILENVITDDSEILILSSSASGVLLSKRMLRELDGVEDFSLIDLGYFPVSTYGAYGLANPATPITKSAQLSQPLDEITTANFEGILILSDTYEGARSWVEQLSVLLPEIPINLLLTAQAGPLLLPYWESGQVTGMVSGIVDAAQLEGFFSGDMGISVRWRAYQAGGMLMIALIVIGALFAIDRTAKDEGEDAA